MNVFRMVGGGGPAPSPACAAVAGCLLVVAPVLAGHAWAQGSAHGQSWRLVEDLRIGGEDGPGALGSVGALAVGRDGSLYVAEAREGVIRQFDPNGRFVRRLGRTGRGPGEFQAIHRLGWKGDTLWVVDHVQERITLFAPGGRVARTLRVSGAPASPGARPTAPAALLADGTVVGDPTLLNLAVRPRDPLVLLDASGRQLATLASVDARGRSRRVRVAGRFFTTFQLPVQHHALWEPAAAGSGLVIVERGVPGGARGASFRVTGVGRRGTLFSREIGYTPLRLPPAVRDSITEGWAAGLAKLNVPRGEALRFARDSLGLPEYQPPVSGLVAGRDGTIWLQRERFGRPHAEWLVLDAGGRTLATVTGPAGVRLLAAQRDRAWGVVTDELDVPYVVRFRVQPAR